MCLWCGPFLGLFPVVLLWPLLSAIGLFLLLVLVFLFGLGSCVPHHSRASVASILSACSLAAFNLVLVFRDPVLLASDFSFFGNFGSFILCWLLQGLLWLCPPLWLGFGPCPCQSCFSQSFWPLWWRLALTLRLLRLLLIMLMVGSLPTVRCLTWATPATSPLSCKWLVLWVLPFLVLVILGMPPCSV